MRKLMLSLMVVSTALAAAPAAAQHGRYFEGYGVESRIDRMERRIIRAADRRAISRREANGLLRQADRIQRELAHMKRDGLSRWEFRHLRQQIARLESGLHFEQEDRDRRRG